MKKTVGILVFDDVEVLDFAGPFEVFSVASEVHDHQLFEVKLIAKKTAPLRAVNGLSVNPNHSFASAPKIDILIIAGGSGTRKVTGDPATLEWVGKVQQTADLTLSICSGATILAALNLLDGRPYCTHHQVYERVHTMVKEGKPQPEKRFVASGPSLFTSGGISAGIDLSFHVLAQLHGPKVAEATARYMEYDLKPQGSDGNL